MSLSAKVATINISIVIALIGTGCMVYFLGAPHTVLISLSISLTKSFLDDIMRFASNLQIYQGTAHERILHKATENSA